MFRTILLLLVATLLACPLRCNAHAAACSGRSEVASEYHCCDACEPAASEPSSPSPEESCDCGNCICHGAVLESGAELLSDAVFGTPAALPAPDLDWGVPAVEFLVADDTAAHGAGYPDGRAARIAHQSLLI